MMDFSRVISATGDQDGILINAIVFEDEEVVQVESRRYSPDDPDFALAVRALEDLASRDDHV
jgi:hypothetical protein